MWQNLLLDTVIKTLAGLFLGVIISLSYWFSSKKQRFSKSFASTVIVLPAIVSVLIFLIDSNLARAVSIGGVFAFIRFRSVPGDSKDILFIFFAMAAGLSLGLGLYTVALSFTVIISLSFVLISLFFNSKASSKNLALKITVPEDLNFKNAFNDIFDKYLAKCTMSSVRTTNMGTLFLLTYDVRLKANVDIKELVDQIRCRNGNLNIVIGNPETIDSPVL